MVVDEVTVGLAVFFGQDLNGGEMRGEAGALELAGLLFENGLHLHQFVSNEVKNLFYCQQ